MNTPSAPEPRAHEWDEAYDWIVLGAGVAGLTAALTAALAGLRTLLVEKTEWVGGTSARSSGTVWIPDNAHQRRHGIVDDAERAAVYLDALAGERGGGGLRRAFIAAGPQMLETLETQAGIAFRPYPVQPDYRQELPGAAHGWRALEPLPFDGRTLGARFGELGWPLPELMLFGGMMVTRGEVARLLRLGRSWDAVALGAQLVARYAADRLRYPRGTRLVLGNALVARLYHGVLERSVECRLNTPVASLIREDGRVRGIAVGPGNTAPSPAAQGSPAPEGATQAAGPESTLRRIHSRCGVVLAGGGFPASAALRQRYLPAPVAVHTPAYEGCTGDTLQLAQDIGGALGSPGEDNALWFPSSIARRKDGSTAVYPHIVLDRAKPGLIAVNAAGRRFANEAASYHEFTRAMYRAHRRTPCIPAALVCDRPFVWRYGLGLIRPRTPFLGRYVRQGYLVLAGTLRELAQQLGVDPEGLAATVAAHNSGARTGVDTEFHRGESPYDRANGDAGHGPNPCLGPIATPPFCAVWVEPTPLGTSLGLRIDADSRVLDGNGRPIAGLYACGNDAHSIFGGEYPGAGSQLGLAMTFGYLAARHAARAEPGGR